ncbi:MAG TPA: VOC family protein, partial [Myxococcaceae bacterium]|nr:VOC family protein [Myxococcaceae bacterium]
MSRGQRDEAGPRAARTRLEYPTRFDVGGTWLPRPFKIRRLGHFGFNVVNTDAAYPFYTRALGFRVSDVRDDGPRIAPEQRSGLGDTRGF